MLGHIEAINIILEGGEMKVIEVKDGCRTKIKMVPDNYEESDDDVVCRDLTTSDRKSIGYSDISKERWDSIFNKDNKDK